MRDISLAPGWVTYLRVSDEDKQTPERSFAMQRHRISEQLLSPSEIEFKHEYLDMLTGTNPNRRDYQEMLSDADAGRFSHLGLYRADRFGRDAVEGLQAPTKLISLGVKLRVANMPSLMPETPDGFFMFLIQMGLAQREVDVLRERTRDGMEAKLRAGGWPQRAPDGYVNKERMVKSNKYERWVELDSDFAPVLKLSWEMLLSERYTLGKICNELAKRGHTRMGGRPWAWNDAKTGQRRHAANRLHKIFHNPFYAGWVTSERFGIRMGEVSGNWQPIVTTQEFQRGIQILHKNDANKSRKRRHFYLLKGILWTRAGERKFKMYGSSPTGRSQSYSYYLTHAKPNGSALHIPCDLVDERIPSWLMGVMIDDELVQPIRRIYQAEVRKASDERRETRTVELKRQISGFREEEARLARLHITERISDKTFDQLRNEWQGKLLNAEASLAEIERENSVRFDDLEVALALMTRMHELYLRLEPKQKAILLQVLAKQIIVGPDGEIVGHELNSPFKYLEALAANLQGTKSRSRGSEQISVGAPSESHSEPQYMAMEQFLAMLRLSLVQSEEARS